MPKKKKEESKPPRTERGAEDPEKIGLYEEDLYEKEELKEETLDGFYSRYFSGFQPWTEKPYQISGHAQNQVM